jgi:hypothetical protein
MCRGKRLGYYLIVLLFLLQGPSAYLSRMHRSQGLLCNPEQYVYIQHRFSSPVPLIKWQRFLTEAVLMSFGSTNGCPKTL